MIPRPDHEPCPNQEIICCRALRALKACHARPRPRPLSTTSPRRRSCPFSGSTREDPMTIRNPRAVLAIAAVLVVLCGCATQPTLGATSWPGCSAFSSQSEAQSAWEADGRPARADGDSDGRVCESLPSTSPSAGGSPSAQTPSSPGAALPTSPAAPAPGSVTTRVSPLQDPRGIHPSLTPVPAGQRARARARATRANQACPHRGGRLIDRVQPQPVRGCVDGLDHRHLGSRWLQDPRGDPAPRSACGDVPRRYP